MAGPPGDGSEPAPDAGPGGPQLGGAPGPAGRVRARLWPPEARQDVVSSRPLNRAAPPPGGLGPGADDEGPLHRFPTRSGDRTIGHSLDRDRVTPSGPVERLRPRSVPPGPMSRARRSPT